MGLPIWKVRIFSVLNLALFSKPYQHLFHSAEPPLLIRGRRLNDGSLSNRKNLFAFTTGQLCCCVIQRSFLIFQNELGWTLLFSPVPPLSVYGSLKGPEFFFKTKLQRHCYLPCLLSEAVLFWVFSAAPPPLLYLISVIIIGIIFFLLKSGKTKEYYPPFVIDQKALDLPSFIPKVKGDLPRHLPTWIWPASDVFFPADSSQLHLPQASKQISYWKA